MTNSFESMLACAKFKKKQGGSKFSHINCHFFLLWCMASEASYVDQIQSSLQDTTKGDSESENDDNLDDCDLKSERKKLEEADSLMDCILARKNSKKPHLGVIGNFRSSAEYATAVPMVIRNWSLLCYSYSPVVVTLFL